MKLNAVETIYLEIPVKVFMSLDDKEVKEIYDIEVEGFDKKKVLKYITDNDLAPEDPEWEPTDNEDDRYDELRDMSQQED
jgi:hypothetical protein